MTVPQQDPITQTEVIASTTVFPWLWYLGEEDELVVTKQVSDGTVTTLVLDTDYTIDKNDLKNNAGGEITPIGDQLPLVVGDVWTLYRETKLDRPENFVTGGAFPATDINPQLDDPIRMIQDRERDLAEAVRKDPGTSDTLNPLIPKMVDSRTIKFKETSPGEFEWVVTDADPDNEAADAKMYADQAAVSAAEAEQSATEAEASATAAAQSASDAETSADEAAASAASISEMWGNVRERTASFSPQLSETGELQRIDTSGGNINVNLLPLSTYAQDVRYTFQKVTSDTNTVPINRGGGTDTINGETSIVLTEQWEAVTIVGDASTGKWSTVGNAGLVTTVTQSGTGTETEFDFTGLPAELNMIRVVFHDIRLSASDILVQIGDSGGLETSGYSSFCVANSGSTVSAGSGSGYLLYVSGGSNSISAVMTLTRSANPALTWVSQTSGVSMTTATTGAALSGGGEKTLSATLDRIRITGSSGTPTFSQGSVYLQYQ